MSPFKTMYVFLGGRSSARTGGALPPRQRRQGGLELIFPQGECQAGILVALPEGLRHVLDQKRVVDVALEENQADRIPGVLPPPQHGENGLRGLSGVKGRPFTGQECPELHLPQPRPPQALTVPPMAKESTRF